MTKKKFISLWKSYLAFSYTSTTLLLHFLYIHREAGREGRKEGGKEGGREEGREGGKEGERHRERELFIPVPIPNMIPLIIAGTIIPLYTCGLNFFTQQYTTNQNVLAKNMPIY